MKWILTKNKKNRQPKEAELATNNYVMKLKKQEILVMNQGIIDAVLLEQINKSLARLLNEIINCLTDDEDDAEKAGLLYDELAKQRSIILNNYEKHLSAAAIQTYMKKIRFVALELKKQLMAQRNNKAVVRRR